MTPDLSEAAAVHQARRDGAADVAALEQLLEEHAAADADAEQALAARDAARADVAAKLADAALGVADPDDVAAAEQALAEAEQALAAIDRRRSGAAEGLQRRLDDARAKAAELEVKAREATAAALVAEAERVGQQYVTAAAAVTEPYERLRGILRALREMNQHEAASRVFKNPGSMDMHLPAFVAGDDAVPPRYDDRRARYLSQREEMRLREVTDQVLAELKAAGVEVDRA